MGKSFDCVLSVQSYDLVSTKWYVDENVSGMLSNYSVFAMKGPMNYHHIKYWIEEVMLTQFYAAQTPLRKGLSQYCSLQQIWLVRQKFHI